MWAHPARADCPVRVGMWQLSTDRSCDLGNRLVSKAMDDRISVATLIEVMRQLKDTPHELFFVFSTQEEVGLRGATAAALGWIRIWVLPSILP